ncbi:hypothetical protein KSP40_PGU006875 [Platanthera guangdongensis]|uniref:Leucine-rich repeat-containing N-terminal plant-type domain-containing protein n=1 Tax=Platanthera guangdongensis TaxID=2320717 RepID=A0ABR2LCF6_9ASPA
MNRLVALLLLLLLLYFLLGSLADEEDVLCLQGIKVSLDDPDGRLSWNSNNATASVICHFVGVTCTNSTDNHVITLSLPSMSLAGTIPRALKFCHSTTTLDLSGNSLSGTIPHDFCDWFHDLTILNLSGNNFTGPIPPELSNCRFLHYLDLASNSLSGQIPASLSRLDSLKLLNLSHNRLSGEIPRSLASSFPSPAVFESNAGLCGRPLTSRCDSNSINRSDLSMLIAIGVFGLASSLLIIYAVWRFCLVPDSSKRAKGGNF